MVLRTQWFPGRWSVRRIFSLPILSKSSPRPRTRSRAFSMARRVADYQPPAGPWNVTLITCDRGREMHRVHDSAYLGNQFNPTSSGNARFSPIRDSSGAIIPTRSMPAQLSTALSWKLSFMICLTRPARFALRGRVASRTRPRTHSACGSKEVGSSLILNW